MNELIQTLGFGFSTAADAFLLAARVVVGAMFFLSGFYKLFSAAKAEEMQKTMVEAGIAAPRQTAKVVSVCEFAFGALLLLGLLTSLASLVLFVISLVAFVTVSRKSVEGASFGYRLSSYLDLPETLLMVILAGLIVFGPGLYSLDWALFRLP